jgi:3-dehydroquinate synthase
MVMAAELSKSRGLLPSEDAARLGALLTRLGLPTRIDFDPAAVIEAIGKDKKRERALIKFVLLEGLGNSAIADITLEELAQWIRQYT